MDIYTIRLANYKTLLLQFRSRKDEKDQPEYGLLTRFADACGVNARYLSHINNGRKNIGEALARQLEVGMKVPHGWMDREHNAAAAPAGDGEQEFIEMATRLYRKSPVKAQAMLLRYMLERDGS